MSVGQNTAALAWFGLLILACWLAACSSSDGKAGSTPLGNTPFTITQTDFSFEPSNISVAANSKFEMEVRNNGSVAHTFTITDLAPNSEGLASNVEQVIQPGNRSTMILTFRSDVAFFCRFHRDRGMTGLVQIRTD